MSWIEWLAILGGAFAAGYVFSIVFAVLLYGGTGFVFKDGEE